MKKTILTIMCVMASFLASCATSAPPVEGLMSLDEALVEITASVETKVTPDVEVGVAQVDAPLPELADFLYD